MEQYTEKQYDDDLTVVADEYNDSFQTDNVDLFEFPSYDESPIARLKSLVLSIDWEITDDILRQFNEELVDLKDIWADEKIYLVYVQALEKISKYIYQEKANANPNAIKLLLTFYYNLEKIISSEEMTEDKKRQILLEDVRKFEKLKQQIGRAARPERLAPAMELVEEPEVALEVFGPPEEKNILFDLKAIVLGIDWEITEKELERLREEVVRLEEVFAGSRPRLIFLQGIGTLGAYINLKKSNAHADAFKLLHSFFAGLEKIVTTSHSVEEEKAILFPEVEKFNAFKAIVGSTIAPQAASAETEQDFDEEDEEFEGEGGGIAPAFSDLPEGETRGFQEEEEAAALGLSSTLNVASQIDMFFSEELEAEQVDVAEAQTHPPVDREPKDEFRDAAEAHLDTLFQADFTEDSSLGILTVDQETALRGVDVETEADDESGEADLPLEAGQLAPALAEIGEESSRGITALDTIEEQKELFGDYENRLDDLFADETERIEEQTPSLSLTEEEIEDLGKVPTEDLAAESPVGEWAALSGASVEIEAEVEKGEEAGTYIDEGPIAALSEEVLAVSPREAETFSADDEELSLVPEEPVPSLVESIWEEDRRIELPVADVESESALEDRLESFFALEETEDVTSLEGREEISEQEMAEVELFAEPASLEIAEIGGTETQGEEQAPMEVAQESDRISTFEEQVSSSLFVQEVLGEEIAEKTEIASFLAKPAETVEEVVFELVEEGEEIFASFEEEGPLSPKESETEKGVGETTEVLSYFPELELAASLPATSSPVEIEEGELQEVAALESYPGVQFTDTIQDTEAGAEESEAAAASFAEAQFQEEKDTEFLAVFEEVAEETEEVVPTQGPAADQLQFSVTDLEAEEVPPAESLSPTVEERVAAGREEALLEEEYIPPPLEEDPLADLRACVNSIGLEMNDAIIQGLFAEINRLRTRALSRPTEKLFLQLLSTIAQHIDRYRYESSSEAFGLLQSVMNTFAASLTAADDLAPQEALLAETTKVLLWQQSMLHRQAVIKGDELTFAVPVRAEQGESLDSEEISFIEEEAEGKDEFAAVFQGVEEEKVSEDELVESVSEDLFEAEPTAYSVSDDSEHGSLFDEEAVFDEVASVEDEERVTGVEGTEAEMAFDIESDSYSVSDEIKTEAVGAEELFFADLEADLAAEQTPMIEDGHEIAPFDQQLRALIQSEFAQIREEWQSDLAALRRELKGDEDQDSD